MCFQFGQLIQLRKEAGRLFPGRVLWTYSDYVAVEVADLVSSSEWESAQRFSIYYEKNHKYVRQEAALECVVEYADVVSNQAEHDVAAEPDDEVDHDIILVELKGKPTVAENRECYRVRARPFDIHLEFADRQDCELLDISHTGCSVLSDEELPSGSVVKIWLPQGEEAVCGKVRIQSVRKWSAFRYRYGLLCLDRAAENACRELAMKLQRRILQRHAGLVEA